MARTIADLGRLIRDFRKGKRITQSELAKSVDCSRSGIALMEQGRRMLNTTSLQAVTEYLGIPATIISSFTSPIVQTRTARFHRPPDVPIGLLCISGISGSGKSTLTRAISRGFKLTTIGSHPIGRSYLADLAEDEGRWAFETQVAFLVTKALEIRRHLDNNTPLVVERWVDEDIAVYERLFERQGSISPRSQKTFDALGEVVRELLPQPEIIICCRCAPQVALTRIQARDRIDSKIHTLDYVERTHALYLDWLEGVRGPHVYCIDTEATNLTRPEVLDLVLQELRSVFLYNSRSSSGQLTFFQEPENPSRPPDLVHLQPCHPERWRLTKNQYRRYAPMELPAIQPIAYLAAPFTGQDTGDSSIEGDQRALGDWSHGHGIIPRGDFRRGLLAIERSLKELGFTVLLPHRDVNEWGRKQLAPAEAMRSCTQHVSDADLFIGVLGQSCGAHYEFGLAYSASKPCLLFRPEDTRPSFLGSGIASLISTDVLEVNCASLQEAANQIRQSRDIRYFLKRHFDTVPDPEETT